MEIARRDDGERAVVLSLTGRLDLVSASALRAAVDDAVESGRTGVVVDLEGVSFLDSSGLGALIAGLKTVRTRGGELRIAAAGEQPTSILDLTRMHRVLSSYATVDEALEGL